MEIKKNYGPFGSTPLSVDEVLPDIQTGRAVYPDKDKEADASYVERINQYKHEGFHDVSEDGGGSSGVGGGVMMLDLNDEENSIEGATWQEAYDAIQNGTMVYLKASEFIYPCSSFTSSNIVFTETEVPNDTSVTSYSFTWMFDGTVAYNESIYPPQG